MKPLTFRHHGIRSLGFLLRLGEPSLVFVFAVITFLLREGFHQPESGGALAMAVLVSVLYGFTGGTLKLYENTALRSLVVAAPRIIICLVLCFGVLLTLLFLFKISANYSRAWLSMWFALSMVGLLGVRAYATGIIRNHLQKGRWRRRMVVLGTNAKAVELIQTLENLDDADTRLVGVYMLENSDPESLPPLLQAHFRGNFPTLLEHCLLNHIDDVILTEDLARTDAATTLINRLNTRPISVLYCLPLALAGCMGLHGLPLVTISRKPMEGHSIWLKRMLDLTASAALLMLLCPLLLVLAALVKASSPGPVFFRQKRGGFNGENFEMLKFRSMYVGSDTQKDANGNEQQALKNDSRITPIGRLLRKSSLDELPQLLNVLRGDMSLVGPRPHAPSHDNYYGNLIDTYASRQRMKPGITGWAQLNGLRGETETLEKMAKRVEYDVWYTQNWSFWLDIKIVMLTPFVVVFQKNAY